MERPAEYKQRDKVTKYMTFELVGETSKTTKWFIVNNKSRAILGDIYWYYPWHQYVAEFCDNPIFNNNCLETLRDFLTELNNKQRSYY